MGPLLGPLLGPYMERYAYLYLFTTYSSPTRYRRIHRPCSAVHSCGEYVMTHACMRTRYYLSYTLSEHAPKGVIPWHPGLNP